MRYRSLLHSTLRNVLTLAGACLLVTCTESTGPGHLAVASIVLSRDSLTLDVGDSAVVWLEARNTSNRLLFPPSANWSSSAPAIATVTGGMILAKAPGVATIAAASGAAADSLEVEVLPPITSTVLHGPTDTIRHLEMEAEIRAVSTAAGTARAGRYTYLSRDTAIAVAYGPDATGRFHVRSKRKGSTWIVATERGGTSDSVLVHVRPLLARLSIGPLNFIAAFVGRAFSAPTDARDSRGNPLPTDDIVVTVADTSLVTKLPDGRFLPTKTGVTRITAVAPNGLEAYNQVSVLLAPGFGFADTTHLGVGEVRSFAFELAPGAVPQASSADASIVEASLSVMPNQRLLTLRARQLGHARIVVSAAGMSSDTVEVQVVDSRLEWRNPDNLATVAAGSTLSLGVRRTGADTAWWRKFAEEGTVAVTSSDTTILRVAESSRQVAIGKAADVYGSVTVQAIAPGTATIQATSPGAISATVPFQVTTGRRVELSHRGVSTMGARQTTEGLHTVWEKPWSVRIGPHPDTVVVTLTHSNPAAASSLAQLRIPPSRTVETFHVHTDAVGVDTIIASAAGFAPDTAVLIVTTPYLAVRDSTLERELVSGLSGVLITDSLGNVFNTRDSLVLVASSSDSSVAVALDGPDIHGNYGSMLDIIPSKAPGVSTRLSIKKVGTAQLTYRDRFATRAPLNVSLTVTVNTSLVIVPEWQDEYDQKAVGLRQRTWVGVIGGGNSVIPTLTTTDTAVLRVGPIGDPGHAAYIIGGSTPGMAQVMATAPGHTPAFSKPIEVGIPRLEFNRRPDTISVNKPALFSILLTDQRSRPRQTDVPVSVRLSAIDGGMTQVDTVIPAGQFESASIPVTFTRSGRVTIVASVLPVTGVPYRPDTTFMDVSAAPRTVVLPLNATVGLGQRLPIPVQRRNFLAGDTMSAAVARRTGKVTAPAALPRTASTLTVVGAAIGADVVVVGGDSTVSDSTRVTVTEGRFAAFFRNAGADGTISGTETHDLVLVVTDSARNTRSVDADMIVALAVTGPISVTNESGTRIDTVLVAAGQASAVVKVKATGDGTIMFSRVGYVPRAVAVAVKTP